MMNDRKHIRLLAGKFLDGTATEQEREELFDWMYDSARLHAMIDTDLKDSDNAMPESKRRRIYSQIVNAGQEQKAPQQRRRNGLTRLLAAACVAMAFVIGGMAYWQSASAEHYSAPLEARTEAAARTQLTLPDGTQVHINSMSRLTYVYDVEKKARIVNLEGEGYFEVAPDKDNPFTIVTNGMSLLCLGTKFDIKNYEDDNTAKVILREGSVKVSSGRQEILMTPGTCVTYNKKTGALSSADVQRESATDWIRGATYYKNESLENIANELSRNYGTRVVISSPEISKETFSGYLGKASLNDVLRALSVASGINYEFINDSTVHLFNNPKRIESK